MKTKVISYDSVDKILGCIRIALVYTNQFLVKDKIPEYSPTEFDLFTYVNRSPDGYKVIDQDNIQLKFYINLMEELSDDFRSKFMFNYIFFLNQRCETMAISRLPSTIDTGRLSTETLTIIFKFNIEQSLVDIELDPNEISSDFYLHTKNLINKGAVVKNDIDSIELIDEKPYTSNIIKLHDSPDKYIMRYSGYIIKDKKFIDPIIFNIDNINNIFKIFIDRDGSPNLVIKSGNTIRINDYSFTIPDNEVFENISYDYVLTKIDNRLRIRRFDEYDVNKFIDLIDSMNYIIDTFTGELYFYRNGLDNHTYATTKGGSNYALEVYCSSNLQKILEDLANGQSGYNNSIIFHHKNKLLLEITNGLAIYKDTTNNRYVFHSHFTLSSRSKYFMVPDEYENEIMLSNRAVLLKNSEGKYYLYELVHNKNNKFKWVRYYIGIDGCLHNIYMLAKQRESNPSISLTKFSYKGNIFRLDDSDPLNKKLITI